MTPTSAIAAITIVGKRGSDSTIAVGDDGDKKYNGTYSF
jgi:hypothetical protein